MLNIYRVIKNFGIQPLNDIQREVTEDTTVPENEEYDMVGKIYIYNIYFKFIKLFFPFLLKKIIIITYFLLCYSTCIYILIIIECK